MKNYFAIGAGALGAMVLLAYLAGRTKGKAKGYTRAPIDQSQVTPGFDAFPVAQSVANAFQGWDFWSASRREVLNDLWRLTDAELSLVYNTYQESFATGSSTMKTDIKNDWVFAEEKDRVINRLTQLGLP